MEVRGLYGGFDGRMVLSHSNGASRSWRFPGFVSSAVIFISFFIVGVVVYSLLSPVLSRARVPLADARLSLLTAVPTTAEGVFRLLLSVTKAEGIFLCLLFLFSFTFFAQFLTRILLILRAFCVASALCRLRDWTQAGVFPPQILCFLFVIEALTSTTLILYAAKAASLSRQLRSCDNYLILPIFKLMFFHLLSMILSYFIMLFETGVLFLITRL